jgi:molybdopterin-guanine dinucleotide biosynthesis protein A
MANSWPPDGPGPAVAGMILAGGLSRRMGGGDKALVDLGGQPMIGHVIARIRPQASALAIGANGNPARFARFGLPVLPDPIEGFAGPLAGVLAGLQWARQIGAQFLVTAPADNPFLPSDLVRRLLDCIGTAEGAVARSRGILQPTAALWRASLARDLAAWLCDENRRAVHDWIEARRTVTVDFPDDENGDRFFNVNTPADLETARHRAQRDVARAVRQGA